MLELIQVLISIGEIKYKTEFAKALGVHKQLITLIQSGKQHFTAENIRKACEIYKVNTNWIYGFETNVFRKKSG